MNWPAVRPVGSVWLVVAAAIALGPAGSELAHGGNTAVGFGSGIFQFGDSATLTNVTIANNTSESAGIFNASSSGMKLKNVILANVCDGVGFVSATGRLASLRFSGR